VAELNAAARAEVGRSRAAGALDIKVTWLAVGLAVIGAAFVLSWAAAGQSPRQLFWVHRMTEWEGPAQDFAEHLANAAELLTQPVWVAVAYPDRTAPGVTATMHQGFSSGAYQPMDPSIVGGGPRAVPW